MSYLDLFQRYGSPSREAEIRLTAYLLRPNVLTADRIKAHDDSAARMIARCNELIDQLTEYRQALAERYAQLATATYRDRLELRRDPGYRGKPVIYSVQIIRTYDDGTTEALISETYTGTDRRKAFARFAAPYLNAEQRKRVCQAANNCIEQHRRTIHTAELAALIAQRDALTA